MLESQFKSFWTKGFSIPEEFHWYFPKLASISVIMIDIPAEPFDEPAKKKSRKSKQTNIVKVVGKNLVRSITATSVSKDSIARFFIPNAQLTSPPATIGPAKVSKQALVWHSQVTPPPAAKPLRFQPVICDEFHEYEWGGTDRGDEEDTITVEMDF